MGYILLRSSGYYFRYQLPVDIKCLVKKSELRYSLQTHSKVIARSKARLMAGQMQRIIRRLRKGYMKELTTDQVMELINRHIKQTLDTDETQRITDESPFDKGYHEDHLKILSMAEKVLQDKLMTKENTYITETVDNLLRAEGIQIDPSSFTYKLLCREMFKAEGHILRVQQQRQKGDYSTESIMPDNHSAHSPNPTKPPKQASKTLSQIMPDFFKQGDAEGSWTPKTKKEVQASMQILVDYFGDIPIDTIDRKMMSNYKRDIMKLPPRMRLDKRYRDKTIHELIELAPETTISVHTINKFLGRAHMLFHYAKTHGEITLNPAEGMKLKKKQRANDARSIFTTDDLKALFGSKEYRLDKFGKSYKFWVPILGAFTGARLEEICSLYLEDFEQHGNIWCININDNRDKSIKNNASKRVIPLHPFLVEGLGIIERVKELKAQNKERFFYDLPKQGGRYGTYVSRWFNETYKASVGIKSKSGKVFHSFRHTFATNLSHNGINDHSLKSLLGHAEQGATYEFYVKRGTQEKLYKDLVEHLEYGLDLDHLKDSKWSGTKINDNY